MKDHGYTPALLALRLALRQARDDLLTVGNDYPGSSCQKWCTDRAKAAWEVLRPWEHCPSTHCERSHECRSVNECSANNSTALASHSVAADPELAGVLQTLLNGDPSGNFQFMMAGNPNAADAFLAHCHTLLAKIGGTSREPSDCENCDGFGCVWNNGDNTSGQWMPCEVCKDERGHP